MHMVFFLKQNTCPRLVLLQSGLHPDTATVLLKCALAPLVSFLSRHDWFLSRMTEAFSIEYITVLSQHAYQRSSKTTFTMLGVVKSEEQFPKDCWLAVGRQFSLCFSRWPVNNLSVRLGEERRGKSVRQISFMLFHIAEVFPLNYICWVHAFCRFQKTKKVLDQRIDVL